LVPDAMSPRFLVDTNVLVYMHDPGDPAKQARACAVIERVATAGTAVLPAQTLSELANVTLKKLKPPLPPDDVRAQIQRLVRLFPVLPLTPEVVLEAVRGVQDHHLSYYDAQIWAVARLARLEVILTEDFNAGAVVDGVAFVDPFAQAFVLEILD
jgi:predicted nucleic acid-binding protein